MRDALLTQIYEHMATDESIFFVTADFGSPVLDSIRKDFANRFVIDGILELILKLPNDECLAPVLSIILQRCLETNIEI